MIPASLNTMMISGVSFWFDVFPTPQIACSLRQLNRNATQCINISNSTNTVSQIIGFSNGYVDLTAVTSFVATYGTAQIIDWYNQNTISTITTLSQATTSFRPSINPSTITENSYAAISFDGANDFLQMYAGASTTSVTLPSQYTMLMTSRNRNATANAGFGMMFSAGAAGSNAGLLCTYQGVCYLGDTTQGTTQVQSTDDRKTFASFLGSRINSTTRKISINNVDETLSNTTYSVPTTIDSLGIYRAGGTQRFSSANTSES